MYKHDKAAIYSHLVSHFALMGDLGLTETASKSFAGETLQWSPEDKQQQLSGEKSCKNILPKQASGQIDIPEGWAPCKACSARKRP